MPPFSALSHNQKPQRLSTQPLSPQKSLLPRLYLPRGPSSRPRQHPGHRTLAAHSPSSTTQQHLSQPVPSSSLHCLLLASPGFPLPVSTFPAPSLYRHSCPRQSSVFSCLKSTSKKKKKSTSTLIIPQSVTPAPNCKLALPN